LGLYIHIPFCKKACNYCNFYFSTTLNNYNSFIAALLNEISLTKHPTDNEIQTIYFGGGTPSLLQPADLQKILAALKNKYNISPTAEITLECNPDDVNSQSLQQWLQVGINRLSVGLQSFNNAELTWMNRAHTAEGSVKVLQLIPEAGFTNYSVDLIYGSPFLTNENWIENIKTVIDHNVPHISCYALTVEEKTKLAHDIATLKTPAVTEERQTEQFFILLEQLGKAGYEHYEISSFCKPGYRSQHNSSYWQNIGYLGLGPSAHSFNGHNKRWWNVANNALYISTLTNNTLPIDTEEELTITDLMNEFIMVRLRVIEGIDLNIFKTKFGDTNFDALLQKITTLQTQGQLTIANNFVTIPTAKRFFADGIAAALFF
jgi:oxygen-independent coproporphyrinogen III oxidase